MVVIRAHGDVEADASCCARFMRLCCLAIVSYVAYEWLYF